MVVLDEFINAMPSSNLMGGEGFHLAYVRGGDRMSLHVLLLTLEFKKKKRKA